MRVHNVPTLFDRLFAEPELGLRHASPLRGFQPAFDVLEHPDHYTLSADLPGVAGSEVEIEFEGGVLEIRGERTLPATGDEARVFRRERSAGRFARRFRFGEDVDVDAIEASSKDGVLTVTVPKSEKAKPRQIPLSVN